MAWRGGGASNKKPGKVIELLQVGPTSTYLLLHLHHNTRNATSTMKSVDNRWGHTVRWRGGCTSFTAVNWVPGTGERKKCANERFNFKREKKTNWDKLDKQARIDYEQQYTVVNDTSTNSSARRTVQTYLTFYFLQGCSNQNLGPVGRGRRLREPPLQSLLPASTSYLPWCGRCGSCNYTSGPMWRIPNITLLSRSTSLDP